MECGCKTDGKECRGSISRFPLPLSFSSLLLKRLTFFYFLFIFWGYRLQRPVVRPAGDTESIQGRRTCEHTRFYCRLSRSCYASSGISFQTLLFYTFSLSSPPLTFKIGVTKALWAGGRGEKTDKKLRASVQRRHSTQHADASTWIFRGNFLFFSFVVYSL